MPCCSSLSAKVSLSNTLTSKLLCDESISVRSLGRKHLGAGISPCMNGRSEACCIRCSECSEEQKGRV